MLNYYKANYPKPDAPTAVWATDLSESENARARDSWARRSALLPGALNGTWEWVEKDLTIVTIPGAGHFVQQDAAQTVSDTMVDWLRRRTGTSGN